MKEVITRDDLTREVIDGEPETIEFVIGDQAGTFEGTHASIAALMALFGQERNAEPLKALLTPVTAVTGRGTRTRTTASGHARKSLYEGEWGEARKWAVARDMAVKEVGHPGKEALEAFRKSADYPRKELLAKAALK